MRPIRLVIAGLNSFKEPQEIDFGRLCEGNVFGIFGPTGSGKSTVVDAITLALYGTVKRASRKTQGIVNKSLTEASVLFEWQLGSGDLRKSYRVERKYVAKDESVVCRLARLSELQGEETVVLADKASQVDQAVQDILGLTEDDFTRAVVLPQGRFAEFLNLQGSERRRMLERIFGLEEYGEQLSRLVSERWKAAEIELQTVVRSQSVLGAATLQDVQAAEEQVVQGASELAATREACTNAVAERERIRQIRDRQQELEQVQLALQDLEQRAGEIAACAARVERQAAAERVRGAIQAADDTVQRERSAAAALEQQTAALAVLEAKEAAAQVAAETAGSLWREQQGPLQKRLEQLERALSLEQKVHTLTEQLHVRLQEGQAVTAQVEANTLALDTARQALLASAKTIEGLQTEMVQNQIDPAVREQLAAAVTLAGRGQQLSAQLGEAADEQTARLQALTEAQSELGATLSLLQEHQQLLASQQATLDELSSQAPAGVSAPDLQQASDYQSEAQRVCSEHAVLARLEQSLVEIERSLQGLGQQLHDGEQQLAQANTAALAATEEVTRLEQRLADAREQNMAAILAGHLQTGQPCPVCGSSEHPRVAAAGHSPELAGLEIELSEARARVQQRQESRSRIQTDLLRWQQQLTEQQTARERRLTEVQVAREEMQSRLAKLPQAWMEQGEWSDLPRVALAHFQRLTGELNRQSEWQAEIDRAKERLQQCATEVNAGQGQVGLLQQAIGAHQAEIKRLAGKRASLLEQQSRLQSELGPILAALGATDVQVAKLRYQQMDQHFTVLDRQINQERLRRDELAQSIARAEQTLGVLKEQQAQARTEYRMQRVSLEELRTELVGLTGGLPAAGLKDSVAGTLEELSEAATRTEAALGQVRQRVIAARQEQRAVHEAHRLAELSLTEAKSALQIALQKETFMSRAEAEEALSWSDLVPVWRKQLEEYRDRMMMLQDRFEQLNAQLAGQFIPESAWLELVEQAEAAAAAQEQAIAILAQAREWLKQLRDRHQQWLALESERQRLARETDLLSELVSLLRGNALVEFMASEHLEAIAGIATDWLGLLSGRRYALEISPDGGFLVRDDGNGGERRPVYTLSGGETFITSLALALALSSQVQLRGRHRLEFFFLDEGFGSLDPELLEVVMGCLERMRGREMSIGLISHVPELRERILRQVQVTPAEPGGRGSRVRLSVG